MRRTVPVLIDPDADPDVGIVADLDFIQLAN